MGVAPTCSDRHGPSSPEAGRTSNHTDGVQRASTQMRPADMKCGMEKRAAVFRYIDKAFVMSDV